MGTKTHCEAMRNFQFPKKVIWHPRTHECCYKNRVSCVRTMLGIIPIGVHGHGSAKAKCKETSSGELVDFADKTMAVNRAMITLQHAAVKSMIDKAKGIVTVGLVPGALDHGIGIEIDGHKEMTANDVRNNVEAVSTIKKACGGEDLSGTRARCEMMFDNNKAYLLLPENTTLKEEGDTRTSSSTDNDGSAGAKASEADAEGDNPDAEGDNDAD